LWGRRAHFRDRLCQSACALPAAKKARRRNKQFRDFREIMADLAFPRILSVAGYGSIHEAGKKTGSFLRKWPGAGPQGRCAGGHKRGGAGHKLFRGRREERPVEDYLPHWASWWPPMAVLCKSYSRPRAKGGQVRSIPRKAGFLRKKLERRPGRTAIDSMADEDSRAYSARPRIVTTADRCCRSSKRMTSR